MRVRAGSAEQPSERLRTLASGSEHHFIRCRWSFTPLGNSHELLSYVANSERLQGITLPGLRRFIVALPKKFPVGSTGFALSSRTLYANDQTVWSTRAPLPR